MNCKNFNLTRRRNRHQVVRGISSLLQHIEKNFMNKPQILTYAVSVMDKLIFNVSRYNLQLHRKKATL